MNKEEVKRIALENGFKLKQQDDGTNDLNTYVYEFADALVKDQHQKLEAEFNTNLSKVEQGIDEMAQGFLVEIESLKAQLAQYQSDGWISVNDQLPEEGIRVILFDSDVGALSGRYLGKYWYLEGEKDKGACITHWQPLPQAPK